MTQEREIDRVAEHIVEREPAPEPEAPAEPPEEAAPQPANEE